MKFKLLLLVCLLFCSSYLFAVNDVSHYKGNSGATYVVKISSYGTNTVISGSLYTTKYDNRDWNIKNIGNYNVYIGTYSAIPITYSTTTAKSICGYVLEPKESISIEGRSVANWYARSANDSYVAVITANEE